MPIEFIRENTYAIGSFEYLLQKLQMGYGTILSLMQVFSKQFINLIPEIAPILDLKSIEDMSHSLARCYTTRSVLSNILGLDKWYGFSKLISDDMEFRVVSTSGKFFPDHTFILIKHNKALYVLQSYYYSYLLAGKYGVLKLTGPTIDDMEDILSTYEVCAQTPLDRRKISLNNERLSTYTGVNYRIHSGNTLRKIGRNNIEILKTYANSQCVMRYIENKMNSFEDVLFSEIGSPDDIIALNFHYYFSDAFKPEAHPLLQAAKHARVTAGIVYPDPRLVDLPEYQQKQVFRDLIGTEYEITTFHGVPVGPSAIPGVLSGTFPFPVDPFTTGAIFRAYIENKLVSVKTIRVTVQQIVDVFVDIKHSTLSLLYNARIENLKFCNAFPQLKPVIILDADRQLEKSRLATELEKNGFLPTFIPQGAYVPKEIYRTFPPP